MNHRSTMGSTIRRIGFAALLIVSTAISWAGPISPSEKVSILKAIRTEMEQNAFVPNIDFKKWDDYIAKAKPQLDKARTEDEFAFAVQAALEDFGLSHTVLLTPQAVTARESHSMVGIGISFAPDTKDGILITRVFKGSAAETADLKAGDKIILVDGKKGNLIPRVRGAEGTKVTIVVQHPDGSKSSYTLTRKAFDIAIPATLTEASPTTDVLTVPTFDLTYDENKIEDLLKQAQSKPNLVIDLRNNPGGALFSMMEFLGQLIPPQTAIGTMVGPSNVKDYQAAHPGKVDVVKLAESIPDDKKLRIVSDGDYYKGHIAVLVNAASGSAAEIAAAALRETRGSKIIGSKSAGAVLVSVIRPLKFGFMLQYPIFDYVTIDGLRLEGNGVIPDYKATDPRVLGVDADKPLAKAVSVVEAQAQSDKSVKVLDAPVDPALENVA